MAATPQKISSQNEQSNDLIEGELVSEFPPPPHYYKLASSLSPPTIPYKALESASLKAVEEMRRKKLEAEKRRVAAEQCDDENGIGKNTEVLGGDAPTFDKIDNESENLDEVAVFGEYVEDPLLAPVEDDCANPTNVRNEISRLNKEIIQGFVKLVRDLVNRPLQNKKSRDELSHNIFLMLQECNKFREHQAREIMIECLDIQLKDRQNALKVIKKQIQETDNVLKQFEKMNEGRMMK